TPQARKSAADMADAEIYSLASVLELEQNDIAKQLAAYAGMTYMSRINPAHVEVGVLPTAYCKLQKAVPINDSVHGRCFVVANPTDTGLLEDLKKFCEPLQKPTFTVASPDAIATF